MNLDNFPKKIVLDVGELMDDIRAHCIVIDNIPYSFDNNDCNNILMDLFNNLTNQEHGVFIGLLKINRHITDSKNKSILLVELKHYFDSLKMKLIELVNNINFDKVIKADNNNFNFYVRERKGRVVILEYLSGEIK